MCIYIYNLCNPICNGDIPHITRGYPPFTKSGPQPHGIPSAPDVVDDSCRAFTWAEDLSHSGDQTIQSWMTILVIVIIWLNVDYTIW